jgi:pyruvate dehydrogenase E2 component (dihydrolipoamide acetyltransferase)
MIRQSSMSCDERDRLFRSFQQRKFNPKRSVPAVSMTTTADISRLLASRVKHNADPCCKAKVTLTHFVIKAVGMALEDRPTFYSAFHHGEIVPAASIRINVPVAEGNHVEYIVIDSPQSKSIDEIALFVASEVALIREGKGRFCSKLREGLRTPRALRAVLSMSSKLYLREYNRDYGNFPITNFGSFGVESGIPTIASPVISALCIGRAKDACAQLLPLTLVLDHRCIDGAEGGRFLGALKQSLENGAEKLLPEASRSAF